VAARLAFAAAENKGGAAVEDWKAVVARLDFNRLEQARPRDIRRAIADIWIDRSRDAQTVPLVGHGLRAKRKSYDRALLLAYLRRFDPDHPGFGQLATAAGVAAERHDWPWRQRGRDWALWQPDAGPRRLGEALVRAEDPARILAAAGLDGDLAQSGFALDALDAVCDSVGEEKGAEAERLGARLMALFDRLDVRQLNGALANALLNPWQRAAPREEYRKRIGSLLIKRIGDPRLNAAAWAALDVPAEIVAVLKRWLTDTTVREFFKVVARTTDNPHQWEQRTRFWTGYLDHGRIDDAWFVLGPRAESLFRSVPGWDDKLPHGRIKAGDGGSGHSALIMSMGRLRIAEWSDNGACRFWPDTHPDAPELGGEVYYRSKLKARSGDRGFLKESHIPSPGWEPKFAALIYEALGVPHPTHGQGWRRQW
jgi:hypothetical protein